MFWEEHDAVGIFERAFRGFLYYFSSIVSFHYICDIWGLIFVITVCSYSNL